MPLITLKPLDDGQKAVEIPFGKTTIGRGPLLGCIDKKVSRNHAVLEVTPNGEVYLTPTHVNPCFYQPTADSPGQILKKDVPHKLENGDSFSLLPRAYRYQLSVVGEVREEKNVTQNDSNKPCGKTNGSTGEEPENGTKEPIKGSCNDDFKDSSAEKSHAKENNAIGDRISTKENNLSKHVDAGDEKAPPISRDTKESSKDKEIGDKDASSSSSPKNKVADTSVAESSPSADAEEKDVNSASESKEDEEPTSPAEHSKVNDSGASEKNCVESSDDRLKIVSEKETEEREVPAKEDAKKEIAEGEDISRDSRPDQKISEESVDSKRTENSEESREANTNMLPPKETVLEDETEDLPPSRTEPKVPAKRGRKKATEPKPPKEKKPPKRKTDDPPKPRGRKKTVKIAFEDGDEGPSQRQTPGRTSGRVNRQTRQGLSLEDFIVSDDDEWQSDRSEPKQRRRKRGAPRKSGDDSGSDWEIEHKRVKKPIHKLGSGSESGSDWGSQKKKKGGPRGKRRKEKATTNEAGSEEEEEPEQTTSNATKNDQPRVPCKYGKKCFRRSLNHTGQFSHPGDSDFVSESENSQKKEEEGSEGEGTSSPKKECPYGENCFRKNPQHKKDFKHTKKVRPQREAAKQAADKKAKGSRNSDEIDSYDLNDSFLNDDSADEYKPVDSGSDYESGEQKKRRQAKTTRGGGRNKRGRKV